MREIVRLGTGAAAFAAAGAEAAGAGAAVGVAGAVAGAAGVEGAGAGAADCWARTTPTAKNSMNTRQPIKAFFIKLTPLKGTWNNGETI